MEALSSLEKNKTDYLNRERSVNISEYMKKQEKLETSGLANIEVLDKAKSLGKDDFLKLLITQLSHQDPTQPVKDQQFIAQMAQFSSLEQMQNISNSVNYMADRQAYGLVGKFIMGMDSATGEMQTGLAEAVLYDESNKPFVRVNGRAVSVSDVKVIGDAGLLSAKYAAKKKSETAEQNASGAGNVTGVKESEAFVQKNESKDQIPGNGNEVKASSEIKTETIPDARRMNQNDSGGKSENNGKNPEKSENKNVPVSLYDTIFDLHHSMELSV
ncbi:MAG: hypothetical protein OEZ34_02365 [Spirochaetia bacterium]|nr:hypothetical protein [Spirochaetia bacterium]